MAERSKDSNAVDLHKKLSFDHCTRQIEAASSCDAKDTDGQVRDDEHHDTYRDIETELFTRYIPKEAKKLAKTLDILGDPDTIVRVNREKIKKCKTPTAKDRVWAADGLSIEEATRPSGPRPGDTSSIIDWPLARRSVARFQALFCQCTFAPLLFAWECVGYSCVVEVRYRKGDRVR